MLTATSRLCGSCHTLLPAPPDAAVCTCCGRVAVPLHADWPPGFKRFLVGRLLESFFAPFGRHSEQYRWERLLHAVIAGRQWETRIIPYAASPEDCFAEALAQFRRSTTAAAAPAPAEPHRLTHVA